MMMFMAQKKDYHMQFIMIRQSFQMVANSTAAYTLTRQISTKSQSLFKFATTRNSTIRKPSCFCQIHYSSFKLKQSSNLDPDNDPELKELLKDIKSDFVQEFNDDQNIKDEIEQDTEEEENDLAEDNDDIINNQSASVDIKETSDLWKRLSSINFETFDSSKPRIIYDLTEQIQMRDERLNNPIIKHEVIEEPKEEEPKLPRGNEGVFDVEELVKILLEQKCTNIIAIKVSPELKYCQHMVICSSNTSRHLNAALQYVKRIYKLKKDKKDTSIIVEGKGTDWSAVDMDNIVLHVIRPEMRVLLDLETLWCLGSKFDEQSIEANKT